MVVIAASIVTESGKVLVSRQFVDMSRTRIKGLLAAFSNLVGACKQHTFVETDEVRFLYKGLEGLYLLLVTNKQSNIFEDLDTLMLLSKLVPEYSCLLNEEGICKSAFKLIFAFDESISFGNKETVTLAQVKQYCEMESQEEKLHKMLMQSKINETKDVMRKRACEIEKSKIENKDVPGLSFKMHPNINKDLSYREHVIGLKDPNSSFTGQNEASLVKWIIQNLDEPSLPLMVNYWPYVSSDGTHVSIEYEASHMFDLQNVVISIPLPPIHETPNVAQIEGEWRYNSKNFVLDWSVPLIDDSNRSGSMDIILPPDLPPASLLPINISFTAAKTYSDVKVTGLSHLRGEVAPKYTQRIKLITDSYQVV